MGKKKVTQTNTHSYMAPPKTPEVAKLETMKAVADPSISYQYGKQRNAYMNSWNNPLGAASSAASRDAAARVTNQALAQDEGQALEQSQYNADNANFGRQATVAGFTQPNLVQTGGTQTQSGGFWSGLAQSAIGAGAQLGSAYMT